MTNPDEMAVQLMEEMDPRLLRLIRDQINSFTKWDLVRLFHDHPHTADTAESLARQIARELDLVAPELDSMARDGILLEEDLGDVTVYSLGEDAEMRALIGAFIDACDDRQFRVKAIYHVIRGLR